MGNKNNIGLMERAGVRNTSLRPDGYPFGAAPAVHPEQNQKEHTVLLLKMNKMQQDIDMLTELVKDLRAELHPRYIGTAEACKILGIGRTKMMERLNSGFYPFAFKDQSGRWKMNQADLYRFSGQL